MLEITHNIPIPEKVLQGQVRTRFPFANMQVGDSLFFGTQEEFLAARSASYPFCRKKQLGWKFSGMFVPEEKGWRLWRTN